MINKTALIITVLARALHGPVVYWPQEWRKPEAARGSRLRELLLELGDDEPDNLC
jgi:hypothetical protein